MKDGNNENIDENEESNDTEKEIELLKQSDEVKEIFANIDNIVENGEPEDEDTEDNTDDKDTSSEEEQIEEEKEDTKEEKNIFDDILKEEEAPAEKKADQMWREKKRRFKAQAALDSERKENERLKVLLKDAIDAAAYNHAQNIDINLNKAFADKKAALDEDNQEKFLRADYDLHQAQIAKHEFEKWKREEEYRILQNNNNVNNNSAEDPADEYEQEVNKKIVSRWLVKHPYLHVDSKNYDEELAERVTLFTHKLNKKLEESDNLDQYLSKDYFNAVDKYISNNKSRPAKSPLSVVSNNNSTNNRTPIGAVRNSVQNSSSNNRTNTIKITLTPDEIAMGRRAGLTEKELILDKQELMLNKQKQARG